MLNIHLPDNYEGLPISGHVTDAEAAVAVYNLDTLLCLAGAYRSGKLPKSSFEHLVGVSTESIWDGIKRGFRAVWEWIKSLFSRIGNFFKDLMNFRKNSRAVARLSEVKKKLQDTMHKVKQQLDAQTATNDTLREANASQAAELEKARQRIAELGDQVVAEMHATAEAMQKTSELQTANNNMSQLISDYENLIRMVDESCQRHLDGPGAWTVSVYNIKMDFIKDLESYFPIVEKAMADISECSSSPDGDTDQLMATVRDSMTEYNQHFKDYLVASVETRLLHKHNILTDRVEGSLTDAAPPTSPHAIDIASIMEYTQISPDARDNAQKQLAKPCDALGTLESKFIKIYKLIVNLLNGMETKGRHLKGDIDETSIELYRGVIQYVREFGIQISSIVSAVQYCQGILLTQDAIINKASDFVRNVRGLLENAVKPNQSA